MSHHDEANLGPPCNCAECVDSVKEREEEINLKFAELEGQDWDDYDNLLRVARAANRLTEIDKQDSSLKHVVRFGDYYVLDWHVIDNLLIELKKVKHLL